ncbi:MAG: hypothetical protein HRU46_09195 [Verrucomicrobiales bacterium]|nr:hypothetical protein [Verrucomicrobiales bacterium]
MDFRSWLDDGFYLGGVQTVNGGEPGAVRIQNALPNRVDVRFQEEASFDIEVNHVAEELGSVYFGIPTVSMEEGEDVDLDGVSNRREILELGTNPLLADTDGDGLSDLEEANGITDGRFADSDSDGMWDKWEMEFGFDPMVPQNGDFAPETDPDGDGWTNFQESLRGMDPDSVDIVNGFWIREHWEGIHLYSTRLLVQEPRFFGPPTEVVPQEGSSTGELFESKFANRIRGYIEAPESGEYQFWISGKTAAELWLSTDETKFQKRLIAQLGPEYGSGHGVGINHAYKWNAFVSQQSVKIPLQAGQRYYIEVLQQHGHTKEAHASVAWARPGGGREPIPADFIWSYAKDEGDQDDDSLPDAWEQLYGLNNFDDGRSDRVRQGQWGDFDGDGLNNHDEYVLNLNPSENDSGAYFESISNAADRIELGDTLVQSMVGALALGDGWALWSDDSIQADHRRARRTFDFVISEDGHYKAQWLLSDALQSAGINRTAVKLYADGRFLGRYQITLPAEGPGQLVVTLPYLEAGAHSITVLHDEISAGHHLRIYGVDLYAVRLEGAEQIVNAGNSFDTAPFANSVSPMFVEGRQRYSGGVDLVVDGASMETSAGPGDMWYSFVSLPESGDPVSIGASFESGTATEEHMISWAATPVMDVEEELQVLVGSSLRLNLPPTEVLRTNEAVIVSGPQGWEKFTDYGDAVAYQFAEPGRYKLKATWKEDGISYSAERFLRASSAEFNPTQRDLKLGKTYTWKVNATGSPIENYYFESEAVVSSEIEDEAGSWRKFRVGAAEAGDHNLIMRLGATDGPVAGQAVLSSFEAVAALRTETELIEQFGNGDRIYRSAIAIDNFPEGATVEISIFVGGVIFTDGTISKTFAPEDFGEQGLIELDFYYPNGTKSSICHRLTVYDEEGNKIN